MKKNSRLVVVAALITVLLVCLMGCDLALITGSGSLEIQLGDSARSINWLPEIDMEIDSYTIRGTGPNSGDSFEEEDFPGGVFTKDSLSVGAWEIVIEGYNEDAIKIATTTINLTIRKSQTAQATATMRPLVGLGTLDVSVSWTDSQDKLADPQVFVLIQDEHGNQISAYSDPIRLTLGEDGKSASKTIGEIPTGWYEVSVGLYEGIAGGEPESVWQDTCTLRIVKDETTEGVVQIPEAEILFGLGSISVVLEEEMDNPFDVSFTGLPESVKEEEAVTVTAAGTFGEGATYRWYVNGVRQEDNTSNFAFVSDSAGLYRISLLVNSNGAVAGYQQPVEVIRATEEVASDIASLVIGFAEGDSADSVMSDVVLPTSGSQGTRITWESNNPACIDTTGTVVRPAYSTGDAQVQLTATVERGTARETRAFNLTVVKLPQTDAEAVVADKEALAIGFSGLDSAATVTQDVTLESNGNSGTTISWQSNVPQTISTAGVVTRPDYTGESDVEVTLTATISKGAISETKTFPLTVKIVLQEQTVTYESNGGSALPNQTVYWGRLIEEPQAPTKVGYSFEGWFTDSELTEQWDFSQDYVSGDVTLYAKWGSGYRISFDSHGGRTPNPKTITIGYGVEYGELATTIKVGYTLAGWYTEAGGAGSPITSDSTVAINEDHTLYAAWQANTYTITFDAQGGSHDGPDTKLVTYGQSHGQLPEPTRESYTFEGWWTGVDGSGNLVDADSLVNIVSDRTLYAKWTFIAYTGPAGGLVFYENPNWETDGWRYLEAAPYGWYDGEADSLGAYSGDDDPFFQWGVYEYSVNPTVIAQAIGSGVSNTASIVSYHDMLWTNYPERGDYYTSAIEYDARNDGTVAAKICSEYSVEHGGATYDDWFLPSKDELNLIYQNLYLQNQGGFSDENYWSSSEYLYLESCAWYQDFGIRVQSYCGQYYDFRVRPVRAF
jgi:uncharacterized repeat protein (TIGR02543 family)